ncbi:hypothetical protein BU17DRAFT_60348 [Hysterangium stoloniferum]|nr:hypothetical protein BU17DRAFT_60348 [Hysterangium stoloniferum]
MHLPKRTGITGVPPVVDAGVEVPAASVISRQPSVSPENGRINTIPLAEFKLLGSQLEQMINQSQLLAGKLVNPLQDSTDQGQSLPGQICTELQQTINQTKLLVGNLLNPLQDPIATIKSLVVQADSLLEKINKTLSLLHALSNGLTSLEQIFVDCQIETQLEQLQIDLAELQERLKHILPTQFQDIASLIGGQFRQLRDDGEILGWHMMRKSLQVALQSLEPKVQVDFTVLEKLSTNLTSYVPSFAVPARLIRNMTFVVWDNSPKDVKYPMDGLVTALKLFLRWFESTGMTRHVGGQIWMFTNNVRTLEDLPKLG